MILLNVKYKGSDGSTRSQYYTDRRIYPAEPFDAPIFTFINCKPDTKTAYVLKINISPRLKISRVSTAKGGLKKMQITATSDTEKIMPPITMYLAKKGTPFTHEETQHFKTMPWSYPCRLLSRPDKIIAYYYTKNFKNDYP